MEISKLEIPREIEIEYKIAQDDKETILFEIGFIWGVIMALDTGGSIAAAVDSCETIKEIIDKY